MVALKPVQGVARVAVSGTANGQPVVNIFHILKQPPGGGIALPWSLAEVQDFATFFQATYRTKFEPLLNTAYTGNTVLVRDLTSETGYEASVTNLTAGSAAGATVPQSAAACITWKIPRHYRGGHPRTYIGPLGTAAFQNQVSLAAATVSTLLTAASTLITAVSSHAISVGYNGVMVCVHRRKGGIELATPLVDEITSATVDTRIDSQRRRLGPDR